MRHEPLIVMLMALIFGIIIFHFISVVTPRIYLLYKHHFILQIEHGMKHILLHKDSGRYFKIHLLIMFLLSTVGYLILGFPGIIIGILFAIVLPGFVLMKIRKKRVHDFVAQLPDILNSISTSLKAGSNLSRAFDQISRQQLNPASQEFRLIMTEYKMGKSIEDALKDMAKRMSCYEVDLMVSAISISYGIGGNLATTLEILSETVSKKLHMEGKIQAITAMGRMQGWVVGLIPVMVLLVMQFQEPEAMSAMYSEPLGLIMLSVISLMSLLAAYLIYKIVNIDI